MLADILLRFCGFDAVLEFCGEGLALGYLPGAHLHSERIFEAANFNLDDRTAMGSGKVQPSVGLHVIQYGLFTLVSGWYLCALHANSTSLE